MRRWRQGLWRVDAAAAAAGPVLLAALLSLVGCAPKAPPENLPPYQWVDEATALRDLAARAAAVHTASARCDLTLVRPDGESVQLDGAVAMAPPGSIRMRAWKFNTAVFDLTLTPEGLWVMTPDDPGRKEKVLPATVSAAQFGREWGWFYGGFFSTPGLVTQQSLDKLILRRNVEDGRVVLCDVDRSTLTPRRYRMLDPAGVTRFTLDLQGYQDFGGIYWPTRLTATGDTGRIVVQMKEVELNGELPPGAFVPPRRAEKRP